MNTKTITPTSIFRLMHYVMLQAVVSFALAADNLEITSSIPAFKAIIDKLKAKLALIAPLLDFNSRPLSGFARRRRELKASIAQTGSILMNAVYNYAVTIGNVNLQDIMRASKTGLFELNYTHLASRMNDVIELITPLLPNLADYDVTAPQITALQQDVNEMISISPKNIYSTRNANKREIQKLLRECMVTIYNESDRQAQSFQKNNSQYFQQYVLNRKLYPNTRHTKYRVHITDELNQPIPDVRVLQNGTTNFNDTNINGDATLYIKVEEGKTPLYNFTISKGNQIIGIGPLQIKKGETVSATIIMQPADFIIPENVAPSAEKATALK